MRREYENEMQCQTVTSEVEKVKQCGEQGNKRKYRAGSLFIVSKAGCGPYCQTGLHQRAAQGKSSVSCPVVVIGNVFDPTIFSATMVLN